MSNWKKLFVVSDENDQKTESNESAPKFKAPANSAPQVATPTAEAKEVPTLDTVVSASHPACAPHMEKIQDMYAAGFDSLNKKGYDFYEFYKSVITAGINNAGVFPMAFNMGKSMEPNLNKDQLVNDAQFYIEEITKVHTDYVSQGEKRLQSVEKQKETEGASLQGGIVSLENQLKEIQDQLAEKRIALSNLDSKYADDIDDVKCKLLANDSAKDNLVSSINKVVNGIKNNL